MLRSFCFAILTLNLIFITQLSSEQIAYSSPRVKTSTLGNLASASTFPMKVEHLENKMLWILKPDLNDLEKEMVKAEVKNLPRASGSPDLFLAYNEQFREAYSGGLIADLCDKTLLPAVDTPGITPVFWKDSACAQTALALMYIRSETDESPTDLTTELLLKPHFIKNKITQALEVEKPEMTQEEFLQLKNIQKELTELEALISLFTIGFGICEFDRFNYTGGEVACLNRFKTHLEMSIISYDYRVSAQHHAKILSMIPDVVYITSPSLRQNYIKVLHYLKESLNNIFFKFLKEFPAAEPSPIRY